MAGPEKTGEALPTAAPVKQESVKDMLVKAKEDGIVSKEDLLGLSDKYEAEKGKIEKTTKTEIKNLGKTMLDNGITLKNTSEINSVLSKIITLSFGEDWPEEIEKDFAKFNEGGELYKELKKALDAQQKSQAELLQKVKEIDKKISDAQATVTKEGACSKIENADELSARTTRLREAEANLKTAKEEREQPAKDLETAIRGITVSVSKSGPRDRYEINVHDGGIFDGNKQSNDNRVVVDGDKADKTDAKAAEAKAKGPDVTTQVPKETAAGLKIGEVQTSLGANPSVAEVQNKIKGITNLFGNKAFSELFNQLFNFLMGSSNPEVKALAEGGQLLEKGFKDGQLLSTGEGKDYYDYIKNPGKAKEGTTELSAEDKKANETLKNSQLATVDLCMTTIKHPDRKNGNMKLDATNNIVNEAGKIVVDAKIVLEFARLKGQTEGYGAAMKIKKPADLETVLGINVPAKAPDKSTVAPAEAPKGLTKEFISTAPVDNKLKPILKENLEAINALKPGETKDIKIVGAEKPLHIVNIAGEIYYDTDGNTTFGSLKDDKFYILDGGKMRPENEVETADRAAKNKAIEAKNATNKAETERKTNTIDAPIKKGDTLSKIAKRYHVTVGSIKEANGLENDRIRAGETLKIVGGTEPTTKKAATPKKGKKN